MKIYFLVNVQILIWMKVCCCFFLTAFLYGCCDSFFFFNHFIDWGRFSWEMSDQLSIPGGLVEKQVEALQVFSSHKCRALNHLWDSLWCLPPPTRSIFMNQSSPRIPCCNLTYHVFLHQLFQEFSGSLGFRVLLPTFRKSIFSPLLLHKSAASCLPLGLDKKGPSLIPVLTGMHITDTETQR